MTKSEVNESCSSNLIFLRENHFQKDLISFRPLKLTLNFQNSLFLLAYFKILEVARDKITIYRVDQCSKLLLWLNGRGVFFLQS